ncbi:MarR family winged helix-turn-helix transcriptional regulator [Okibacterium endophyticum]
MASTDDPAPVVAQRLGDDVSFLLARANAQSVIAGNEALTPFGLKVRSYSVLAFAADEVKPTQREIAEFLRLDPSQVVALVDDLQQRGLVVREPDPHDRRANVVVLTGEGRSVHAGAAEAVARAELAAHAGLSDDERGVLHDLLRRLAFPA